MKSIMQKYLIAILSLSVLLICTFGAAIAEANVTIVESDFCGTNVTYQLDSEGTLTIRGEGTMENFFKGSDVPWYPYRTSITNVVIGESVTSIGSYAFYGCSSLTSINIPDSVTSIANGAFYHCSSLASINIPNSVTSIGDYAFDDCSSLTSINIPNSVARIGFHTFYGCSSFTNIHIPDGVTSIGDNAFSSCRNLTSINIPDGVTSIGGAAFSNCSSLTSINIPDGVTSIGLSTFYGCSSLTNINIPNSVTSIGNYAFNECSSLTSINIPDGVTSIGNRAFYGCSSLTNVYIPDSVTSIGSYAFYYSTLRNIVFPGTDMPDMGDDVFAGLSTIYCYEYSDMDFWAAEMGYTCVYLDNLDMTVPQEISLPDTYRLLLNNSVDLSSYVFPQNAAASAEWTSSAPQIISVEDGVITALSAGKATITAAYGELSDTIAVASFVTLSLPNDCRLTVGESTTIVTTTNPQADMSEIQWESSAPDVVFVENGVITALDEGIATITASWHNVSDTITVTAIYELTDFQLSTSEMWIASKDTAQIEIVDKVHENAPVEFAWTSSDTYVLTVSEDGLITAKVPGVATITVTSDNGVSRSCIVHVCYPVTAIDFEASALEVVIGDQAQLIANVTTRNETFVNKLVSFTSSDESIATVDETGLVTTHSAGVVTITASTANGLMTSAKITVFDATTMMLPSGVKVIDEEAFVNANAERVVIPSGCEAIGIRAFAGNTNLIFVHMPDSITFISDDAFDGCDNIGFICESENTAAEYATKHGIPYQID